MFKVLYNTGIQFIGKIITATSTLLVTIIIAKQYGADGFGDFTKIISYVAFFYLFSDFGLNAITLRRISKNSDHQEVEFRSLFGLRIVLSLALLFFASVLPVFFPYDAVNNTGFSPEVKLGIILLSFTILTQAVFRTTNVIFQEKLRYDYAVIAASLSQVVTLALVFLFASMQLPLFLLILSYIIGGIVMVFFSLFFTRRFLSSVHPLFYISRWRTLLRRSLPLGLTLIFNVIYFRADIFLLAFFRPSTEVGLYGLAYKFFEFPLTLPVFFMNAMYPLFLRSLSERKHEGLFVQIKKSTMVLFVTSIVLAVIGFFLAPLIPFLTQNKEFVSSVPLFRMLIVSLPLFFISPVFMWAMITLRLDWHLIFVYSISAVLNIALNLFFIPLYGAVAAAMITVGSEALILFLSVLVVYGKIKTALNRSGTM